MDGTVGVQPAAGVADQSRLNFDLNWAQAAFDWPARTVTFAVRDKKGEVVFVETVDFGAKKTAAECTTGQGAHLVCGLAFWIPQLVASILFLSLIHI